MIVGFKNLVIPVSIMMFTDLRNEIIWYQTYQLGKNRLSGEKSTFVHVLLFGVVTQN